MTKATIKYKDNTERTVNISEIIDLEGIKTIIEDRINNGTAKINGNLGIGSTTYPDGERSNGDIISIEIIF